MSREKREMPTDPQAEMGLLSSLVLLGKLDMFAEIEGVVDADDFHDADLGKLFAGMKRLHDAGMPIDNPAVMAAELPALGVPESVRSPAFLFKLLSNAPNAAHLTYYAEQVRNAAQKRRLIVLANRLLESAHDAAIDPQNLIHATESELSQLNTRVPIAARSIGEYATDFVANVRQALANPGQSVTMTGIPPLDEVIGPLMRKELIILAARPGIGKTACGMQIAMHAANKGKRVFFASLEMHGEELASRIVCRIADINSKRVRSGDVTPAIVERLESAASEIALEPVYVWSPPSGTLSQVRGIAKHFHAKAPLSLVVVDYLTKIAPGPSEMRMQREERAGNVAIGLRQLAKELDVPVLALAQFNRTADNQEPTMAMLRESGQIEQEANVIIALHAGDTADDQGEPFTVTALVLKHRAGMKGRVRLTFHPVETRFSECVTPDTTPAKRKYGSKPGAYPKRNSEFDSYNNF